MTASITERIEAGVAWLDVNHPGWVDSVDPSQLNIRDCARCVLGQVFGGYHRARLSLDQAVDFGFDADSSRYPYAQAADRDFAELQEAWLAWFELEAARRAAACCPCRGLLCDPGCACRQCPKSEGDIDD